MPARRLAAGETRELQKLGKICGEPFFLSPPFRGPADYINLDGLFSLRAGTASFAFSAAAAGPHGWARLGAIP